MKKRKTITITAIALVIVIVSGAVIWKMLGIRAEGEGDQIDTSKWDTENRVNIVYDTAGVPVPVPKGYTASSVDGEHTVNTGFVIYEGEEAVIEENKDTAQRERNQWVWVPVTEMSDIYITDEEGKKHGQLWEFSETGRTIISYSTTGNREPDILRYYDSDYSLITRLAEENQTNLNDELQKEFENTISSIEKYGGFYIGRYETGDLSKQKIKVVKGNTDLGNQNWYTMYRKSKEIIPNENKNVLTSMIWGSLWDHTLNWLVTSGDKEYTDLIDSTSWGNYSNSTFEYNDANGNIVTKNQNSYTEIPTGSTEYTKANNIYDIAGNITEWSLEASYRGWRAYRGGANHDGSYWPNGLEHNIRITCYNVYKVVVNYKY